MNQFLIKKISKDILNIQTNFRDSREFNPEGKKLDRLIDLLVKSGTNYYISGPAAKSYIDEKKFIDAGIELEYKDYSGYPEYPQLFPPFEHFVSIIDLIFNCGSHAPEFIWDWRN